MSARYGKHAALAAAVLLIVGISYWLGGCPGREQQLVQEFDSEPEVTVRIEETGEKRRMPVERYVAGVVAGEMKKDWPVEAYGAQAILARSFVMDQLSKQTGSPGEVSSDPEQAQAYKPENITPAIEEAVKDTRGEVMTFGGRYVRAWFHSYSGGVTATASEGLDIEGEEPSYIKSVRLPQNEFAPDDVKDWTAEYSAEELQTALSEQGVSGPITSVEVTERGPTRRITEVTVEHEGGETKLSGTNFRLVLDPMKMKSTLVTDFSFDDGTLKIRGRGFGHGVGLSQWDAHMFARRGDTPEEIVERFFDGIEIRKLWD